MDLMGMGSQDYSTMGKVAIQNDFLIENIARIRGGIC